MYTSTYTCTCIYAYGVLVELTHACRPPSPALQAQLETQRESLKELLQNLEAGREGHSIDTMSLSGVVPTGENSREPWGRLGKITSIGGYQVSYPA